MPSGTNWPAGTAAPWSTRSVSASRLIASERASRTRGSFRGFLPRGLPSLPASMGELSRFESMWMYIIVAAGLEIRLTLESLRRRSWSTGLTMSMMSTSPASRAATRDGSEVIGLKMTLS